jgi:hypothetical protein
MTRYLPVFTVPLAFVLAGCDHDSTMVTTAVKGPSIVNSVPTHVREKPIDVREWRWSVNEASLLYCLDNCLSGYEIQVVRPEKNDDWRDRYTVRILRNGQLLYSFHAHGETVFTNIGGVFFVCDFSPIATGCKLVAFDLEKQKELWRCALQGNPPSWHSKYRHQVNITKNSEGIVIYGKESNGRYIEIVDPKVGKSVYNRKLPPE